MGGYGVSAQAGASAKQIINLEIENGLITENYTFTNNFKGAMKIRDGITT